MCGVAGLLHSAPTSEAELINFAVAMAGAIAHRGPDDFGFWSDPALGLALAHQRLSVLDLSPAGHQPMASFTGRYIVSFNGEIYNHLTLRRELEATGGVRCPWRGYSDTETLLAAIEAWGLESTLQRCSGMFALALLDRSERRLHLARDRFGEKPLYYGLMGSESNRIFLFASELASLRAHPSFANPIHRPALAQLLRFGAIAAPLTIYSGIRQLLPGHLVTIQVPLKYELPQPQPWWCFRTMVSDAISDPFLDPIAGLEALETALSIAVQQQSLADVCLGSFLSGGVDSTLITALLQAHSSRPVRTFTIGFDVAGFNEAPYAQAVAAYLGTDHSETTLSVADAQVLIPQLPRLYSEPFADSSQIPSLLVCREARQSGLTVALSGDGGDELFGGYNRYLWGPHIWNRLAWLPMPLRRRLALLIRSFPSRGLDAFGGFLSINQIGSKAHKFAESLQFICGDDDLYISLVSAWLDPASLLQQDVDGSFIQEPGSPLDWPLPEALRNDSVARMMARDTINYLPNDILTKMDRASMATSLEVRAPFLDHHVAAVAWRLPMSMKIYPGRNGAITKWALRQILYKYVPKDLIDRPKAGFAIPIGRWLRGPLRVWADDLLEPGLIERQGYLRPEPIQALWRQHLSGRFDNTVRLWSVLMWQAWLAEYGELSR